MGLEQLKKLDQLTEKRKLNFNTLHTFMQKYETYFILPSVPEGTDPSWFSYPITIRDDAPFSRFDIVNFLESHKIQTRNFFGGNLLDHPAYKKFTSTQKYTLNNASIITNKTFMLGVWPGLNEEIYTYVFSVIDDFFQQHSIV